MCSFEESFRDRVAESRKHGNIFPLGSPGREHVPTRVTETVRALNKLAGFKFTNSNQLPSQPTAVQELTFERIFDSIDRAGDCPMNPEEALDSMTRSKNLYAEEPNNLVSYDPAKLKILQSKVSPKRLESIVPPHVQAILNQCSTMIERDQRDVQTRVSSES